MSSSLHGASLRIAAFGWDYLLIAAYITALTVVSWTTWLSTFGRLPGPADADPWIFDLLAFTTLVVPVTLYFALSECSERQGTWGKRRCGLKVVSVTGGRLGLGRSLLRSGLKFLPWQVAHTSLFHIPGWPTATVTIPPAAAAGLALSCCLAVAILAGLFITRGRWTPYDQIARSRVLSV